jgi:hypothetical protein
MMVKEFEISVKQHGMGDIFTVDVPSNQWYYVVKKTYEDKNTKEMTILKVMNPSAM